MVDRVDFSSYKLLFMAMHRRRVVTCYVTRGLSNASNSQNNFLGVSQTLVERSLFGP